MDRRFQIRGAARGVTVVDDYGHHPTEIRATLAAARECGHGEFTSSFSRTGTRVPRTSWTSSQARSRDADTVIVLPIYAASEEPILGVTAERLAGIKSGKAVRVSQYAPDFAAAIRAAVSVARAKGDLILTLGQAVLALAPQILAALELASDQAVSLAVNILRKNPYPSCHSLLCHWSLRGPRGALILTPREVCMNPTGKKIVIVGGGIAGLCAAVYAQKCGYQVEVSKCTTWRAGWR